MYELRGPPQYHCALPLPPALTAFISDSVKASLWLAAPTAEARRGLEWEP